MVMGWVCAMAIRSMKAIPLPNETLLGNSQVIETESAAPSRECHSTSDSVFKRRFCLFYPAPESCFLKQFKLQLFWYKTATLISLSIITGTCTCATDNLFAISNDHDHEL